MAFMELKLFSESLGMQTAVNVILPQNSLTGEIGTAKSEVNGKYKCLYLLHGLSDDHTIWCRRTSIERYASMYGICVVMPCGDTSFYTDMKYGKKYYTYIAKELPALIRQFFNVSDKREDNYIAGLSMGGYGALKIGLRENAYFSKAAGLSSAADITMVSDIALNVAIPIFGEDLKVPEDDDLFLLADKKKDDPLKPDLYLGIGTEDFLYDCNQSLKEKLISCGYHLTYRESEGNHSWDFWDEYIQYVLEWMLKEA